MIVGLKFAVTGQELRDHTHARMEHHRERRAFYEKKAAELEAGGAEAMQYSNGDPVRGLREKAAEHQRRQELFLFMHNHLSVDETYQLADDDLQRVEILTSRW